MASPCPIQDRRTRTVAANTEEGADITLLSPLFDGVVAVYAMAAAMVVIGRAVWRRSSDAQMSPTDVALEAAFALSVSTVLALTVGWGRLEMFGGLPGDAVNLVPLRGMRQVLVTGSLAPTVAMRNLLGNVALFIPVGLFAAALARPGRAWRGVLVGFMLSVTVEVLQYTLRIPRATDIDDVILNTLGAAAGVTLVALGRQVTDWKVIRQRPAPRHRPNGGAG